MIIAVDNDSSMSFEAAAALVIGEDDDCDGTAGGVTILTKGDFNATANVEVYGSKVIALGNIAFTSNGSGMEGASFIAGGTISSTSNNTLAFCPGDGDNTFNPAYFRMVM